MGLFSSKEVKRFETIHEEHEFDQDIRIFRDRMTGVNYLAVNSGVGFAITPLLDSERKVVVTEETTE